MNNLTPGGENVYYTLGKLANTLGWVLKPVSHPDQLGQGSRLHLFHHPMAVNPDRGLARAQLSRYLLVEQPGHDTLSPPCGNVN
jgi:hypothetical protein